jgi:hypothetical protein
MWKIRLTVMEEWNITEGEFVSRLTKKIREGEKKVALYYDCRDFAPADDDSSDSIYVVGKGQGKKTTEVGEETVDKPEERLSVKVVITDKMRRSILMNCVCTSCAFGFEELGIINYGVNFNKLFLAGCDIPDEKIRIIDIKRLPNGFHDAFFAYAEEELNLTLDLAMFLCLNASQQLRKKQIEFLEQWQELI